MMGREDEYISLLGSSCPSRLSNAALVRPYNRPRKCSLAIELNSERKIVTIPEVDKVSNTSLDSNDFPADSDPTIIPTDQGKVRLDGGYGWVVVAASFICLSVLDGVSYSFGIFMGPLMEDLGTGLGAISAAGSLQIGIYAMSGLVVSKFVTCYGTRIVCVTGAITSAVGLIMASFSWNLESLYTTYSVITGLGFGMMYIPAIVAVAEHFDERRSLAVGICVCGTGVGTFFIAPLESYLLDQLGWRWSLVCLGCACLCCVLCGLAMTPVPIPREEEEERDNQAVNSNESLTPEPVAAASWIRKSGNFILGKELAAHRNVDLFFLLVLADAIGTLALFVPFTYMPEMAKSIGVPANKAAMLLSAGGICSSVGRILSGWINDRSWSNPICLTSIMVLLAALQPLLITCFPGFCYYLVFSCLFGFATGVWIAATTPFLLKVLPLELLSPGFGVITASQGIAGVIGSPFAGALVDNLGSVEYALIFATSLLFLSALVFAVSFFCSKRREVRSSYEELL